MAQVSLHSPLAPSKALDNILTLLLYLYLARIIISLSHQSTLNLFYSKSDTRHITPSPWTISLLIRLFQYWLKRTQLFKDTGNLDACLGFIPDVTMQGEVRPYYDWANGRNSHQHLILPNFPWLQITVKHNNSVKPFMHKCGSCSIIIYTWTLFCIFLLCGLINIRTCVSWMHSALRCKVENIWLKCKQGNRTVLIETHQSSE